MVVYLLRDLHFSCIELMCNTAASIVVQFLVLNRWGRLGDVFGNRVILSLTGFVIPVVPVLWVLSPGFWYLLAVQAFSGLVWSGFSLSASNYVYDLTPSDRRGGIDGAAWRVGCTGSIYWRLPGQYAGDQPAYRDSLFETSFEWLSVFYGICLVSAALRLMVASVFIRHIAEVRRVRATNYSNLVFRVTRFSPISGLIFDIVSRLPKADADEPGKSQDNDRQDEKDP